MQFLNPLALFGLAAALIPLAIHLLHRSSPRDVPFSHLTFLRELHQSRMRSVRLRQWLVLLLRVLALACLALAFSRPALRDSGGLLGGARAAKAVILLDHSYSTRYTPPTGRWFDRLRQRAESVLSLLENPDDEVYLLPMPALGDQRIPSNAEAVRQRLVGAAPGQAATQVDASLAAARQLLADDGDGRQRELYIVSDMARPGWDDVSWLSDDEVTVFAMSVGAAESASNHFVNSVVISDWLAAQGRTVSLRAQVGRSGTAADAQPTAVDLYIDGERIQQRRVTVEGDQLTGVDFSFAPRRSGLLTGFVQIPDDNLRLDDRHWFTLWVPERIRVLIAGEPADTYYPRRALHAAAAADPTLELTTSPVEALSREALRQTDVLILANVERIGTAQARSVRQFAATGGGVLIVPGPDADISRLNRDLLDGLVPAALTQITGRVGQSAAVRFDSVASSVALLHGLLNDGADEPQFAAHFGLAVSSPLAILAHLDNDQPLLVEGRGPSGHVLLWAVPFDLDWSDMPVRGLFAPLLQRIVRALAPAQSRSSAFVVGQSAWRRVPSGASRVSLPGDTRVEAESPSGRRIVLQSEQIGQETLWRVPRLDEAGIWRLFVDSAGTPVDAFAVNADVVEADVTQLTADDLQRVLGQPVHWIGEVDEVRDAVHATRYGQELWRELLAIALLLLLVEMWVARAPDQEQQAA